MPASQHLISQENYICKFLELVVYLRYRSRELSRGRVNFRLLYIDVLQVTSESRGHCPIESPLLAAIESANREVRAALNPESASSKRKGKKPHVYSPHERAELGKLAVDIGGLFLQRRHIDLLHFLFPANKYVSSSPTNAVQCSPYT